MKGYTRQRSKGKWEITIDTGRDPSTDKRLRHFETVIGGKKEAQHRLATYGPNRLRPPKKRSPWILFLAQFNNILI